MVVAVLGVVQVQVVVGVWWEVGSRVKMSILGLRASVRPLERSSSSIESEASCALIAVRWRMEDVRLKDRERREEDGGALDSWYHGMD